MAISLVLPILRKIYIRVYFLYTMESTTVKIHKNTKNGLDEIKNDYESYDEVIKRIVSEVKQKNLVKELVAAYKTKAIEDKEINKEWETTSPNWD